MTVEIDYSIIPQESQRLLNELSSISVSLPVKPDNSLRGIDHYSFSGLIPVMQETTKAFAHGNHHYPSIVNPLTFNEKLFASKFITPFVFPSLADKIYANEYVRSILGDIFVPKIIMVSKESRPIVSVFRELPPGRFLLKGSNGSGTNIFEIPKDKTDLEICADIDKWSRTPFGERWGEWHYSRIENRFFIEERLPSASKVPLDYKFYCFGGRVELIHVDHDRFVDHSRSVYTRDFEPLPVKIRVKQGTHIAPPAEFSAMRQMAEDLASKVPHPFIRIDLYYDEAFGIKFGEFTYTPENATGKMSDRDIAMALGRRFSL